MTQETTSGSYIRTTSGNASRLANYVKAPPLAKLAFNEVTTFRWSLLEDVTSYREAGVEAIGIWRPKLSEFGEERGVELVKDSGLSVSSLSWVGGFTGIHGQSFVESLDDARDAIATAGQLRAEAVTLVSGPRGTHTLNHARRLLVEALKSLADHAAEEGVCLAVQPMHARLGRNFTFLSSIDETLEILDRCRHPAVKMAFDVYHLWQEPRLLERIREIAKRVATVQISDGDAAPAALNDGCLLGDGVIPLSDIVRAFVDAEYDGRFEVSIWSEALWKSDYRDVIRACWERFDTLCRS